MESNNLEKMDPTIDEVRLPFFSSDGSVTITKEWLPATGSEGLNFTAASSGGGGAAIDGLGYITADGKYLPLNGYSMSALGSVGPGPWTTASYLNRTELPTTGSYDTIYTVTEFGISISYIWASVSETWPQDAVDGAFWGPVEGGRYIPILLGELGEGLDHIAYCWDGSTSYSPIYTYRKPLTLDTFSGADRSMEVRIPWGALGESGGIPSRVSLRDYILTDGNGEKSVIDPSYIRYHVTFDWNTLEYVIKFRVVPELLTDTGVPLNYISISTLLSMKF
jgi:hypothetical protein